MKSRYLLKSVLLLVIMGLVSHCKKDNPEDAIDPTEFIQTENLKIISTEDFSDNLISMDSVNYTLTFSSAITANTEIKTGDVIVSGLGDGLLRKVSSVTTVGSTIVVKTEFADLTDAIAQGDVEIDQPLYMSQVKSIEYYNPGLKLRNEDLKAMTDKFIWDISTVLYDADGTYVTDNDQIRLEGDFSFEWRLKAKIKIAWFCKLKEVDFGIESSESLNLNLIANANLGFEYEKTLAKIKFNPIYIYIGGFPVVIKPVITINVGAEGNISATVSTGFSQSVSFDAGIKYIKGSGWSPYKIFEKSFDFFPPSVKLNADATAYIKPELEMKIYDVGGPYANLKLYTRLEAELQPTEASWGIYGGISLGAGVRMKIFDKLELDYSVDDLLVFEKLIMGDNYTLNFDLPEVETLNITSYTSTSAILKGNVISDGNTSVTERGFYWGIGNDPDVTGTKVNIGSGSGSFEYNLQNINPNTCYYVRSYAVNSLGTSMGEVKNFTTLNNLTLIDVDGNMYATVTIGNQVWMKENLRTTKLNDGTAIDNVTDNTAWAGLTTPARCEYNNDMEYGLDLGVLYNWYTVNTSKLCPIGWHVPTDTDWNSLVDHLGGENIAGGKLKEIGFTFWSSPNTGATNESGFTARASGGRSETGLFTDIYGWGYWWSKTLYDAGSSWGRTLFYNQENVYRSSADNKNGFSVRCVKN